MRRSDEFKIEYQNASRLASSTRHFSDILTQHALVMVDAALPDLKRHKYIELGTRLAEVQRNWINLLCVGIDSVRQTELDRRYRNVVTEIIKTFTENLMKMLIEDKVVRYGELACVEAFHSAYLKHHHREMKHKFIAYVNSLYKMYSSTTQDEYYTTAMNCMAIAHSLGVFLDDTVFE